MGVGANTDHFGLASADWELQENSKTPSSSKAQVANQFGDIEEEDVFEETETVECSYKLTSNGAAGVVGLPANFKGGYKNGDYVITGGTLKTSNKERPELTVTGTKYFGPATAVLRVYDFAGAIGDILARKAATAVGFTLGASTFLNGCDVKCSVEDTHVLKADGDIAVIDTFNGRLEATGDLVAATGSPSATAAANWTLDKGNDVKESNKEYPSGSVTVFRNLAGV
jgi:hypothetical protein